VILAFRRRAVVSEFAKHSDENLLSSPFEEMENLCLSAGLDGPAGISLVLGQRPKDPGSSLVKRLCYPWLRSGVNKYFLYFGIFLVCVLAQSFGPFLFSLR